MSQAAEQMFTLDFHGPCLAFDSVAAKCHAVLVAHRVAQGLPISTEDGQIAAIALANGLVLATRNTRDFENINGLKQANPWHDTHPH